ncbi:MAG TPA: acylphosphatase [bacterium]|nr:acylphosphatase [bacterium]HPN43355.1 acylphosphatase [bacterium]
MICAHIQVSGVVQGVGFRYFALREANALGIKGYVRNQVDGSVESVAEGDKALVEAYIRALQRGPAFSQVTDINVSWSKYEKKYNSFTIR